MTASVFAPKLPSPRHQRGGCLLLKHRHPNGRMSITKEEFMLSDTSSPSSSQRDLALPNMRRVYMLDNFTVERRAKGWFFCRTTQDREKAAWRGPYASIASVTLMIARQLRKEVERRDRPFNID